MLIYSRNVFFEFFTYKYAHFQLENVINTHLIIQTPDHKLRWKFESMAECAYFQI